MPAGAALLGVQILQRVKVEGATVNMGSVSEAHLHLQVYTDRPGHTHVM